MIVIIEGIDRIGKSTCASHLCETYGFEQMHFGKPSGETHSDQAHFQMGTFDRTFKFFRLLDGSDVDLVMDRCHLGELVYGPMYRGDSGVDPRIVMNLEASNGPYEDCKLVLLVHDDLDVVRARDDGLGFDSARAGEEQEKFKEAFDLSVMPKTVINVTGKTVREVLEELDRYVFDETTPNFERDLDVALGDEMEDSKEVCEEVWCALANVTWVHQDTGETAEYSFRSAGGLIAEIIGDGNYLDWYCCRELGVVSARVSQAMEKRGWTFVTHGEGDE